MIVRAHKNCPVLLVEDNSQFRAKIIQHYLRNCNVYELSTGENFKTTLASEEFHFILMDYELPDTSGDVLTAKARELGFNGGIIGISSSDYLNQKMLQCGADTAVSKRQAYLLPKMIRQAVSIAESRGYNSGCSFGVHT